MEIELAAVPSSAGLARQTVCDSARKMGCCADDIDTLAIAIGEAFANVVIHGSGPEGEKVRLRVKREATDIIVGLVYLSDPFDAAPSAPTPDLMAIHGYGLLLMRTVMDEVKFAFEDGQVHLTMQKRCLPA